MGDRTLVSLLFLSLACLCSSQVKNWAGNIEYDAALFTEPESVEEVIAIVKQNERVSIVGTRHSFNNISQTNKGALVSTKKLNKILSCCNDMAVTIQPGITYAELGGAIATATHGSGAGLGNLATSVRSLELVAANGDLVRLTRGDPLFKHAVVTLGAGGVVVEVSLDVEAAFDVQQCIYTGVSFKDLKPDLNKILAETYSVSLFTQYRQGDLVNSLCGCAMCGGSGALSKLGVRASSPRLGQRRRLLASREELQTELFIKREDLEQALDRLFRFEALAATKRLEELLLVAEIRFIAPDELTLSPQRVLGDTVGLHFTWKPDVDKLLLLLPQILDVLSAFNPIPHWAKVFDPHSFDLEQRYGEALVQFKSDFLDRYDPHRKFTTDFVRKCLFPTKLVDKSSSNNVTPAQDEQHGSNDKEL